ncbi:MAG TPA: hypothetical protein VN231_06720 [Allosphingosinicella sp.]|nr:hypothetical protein [Allosphingosinicella sp.]
MKAQPAAILVLLLLGACGERAPEQNGLGSTTPPYVRPEADQTLLGETVSPVRIGEFGPSFAACTARGTTRNRVGSEPVPVRAAPFEQAQQIDSLEQDAQFFICSRSHDQRWFGIVYDEGGRAGERCGVSSPVPSRRSYRGPCAAGWVPSGRIRQISGVVEHRPPAPPPND